MKLQFSRKWFLSFKRQLSFYSMKLKRRMIKSRLNSGLHYLEEHLPADEYKNLAFYHQVNSIASVYSSVNKAHFEIQMRYRDVA